MPSKPTTATVELATLLVQLQQLPAKPKWFGVSTFIATAKQQMAVLAAATTGKVERQKLARELRLFIRKARGAWLLRRGAADMPVCLKVGNAKRSKQPEAAIFRDFFAWAAGAVELRALIVEAGLAQAKKQYVRYQLLSSKEVAAVPQLAGAVRELRRLLAVARTLCK